MSNRQEVERLNQQAIGISLRASAQAQETTLVGRQTVQTMETQTEQLTRINFESEDTLTILKQNKKIMKDMNRCWFLRLCCFSKAHKRAPSPTKWHGDKTDVDLMLKAKNKDKWLEKRAKGGRSSKDEVDESVPVAEKPVPVPAPDKTQKTDEVDEVVNAELTRLSSALDELRDLATEISVQSAVQQRLAEDLAEGVERTREGVKENERYFHKVAPKIKKTSQDEYVNTADKILIQSAAASLKHKVTGSSSF